MENVEKEVKQSPQHSVVNFGNGSIVSAVGALCGLGIAVGVPLVLLAFGQALGVPVVTGLVIAALLIGSAITFLSAFFGLVIPRHVGGPWGGPREWAALGAKWKRWEREYGRPGGESWQRPRHWDRFQEPEGAEGAREEEPSRRRRKARD
jgi:hypothetical protein